MRSTKREIEERKKRLIAYLNEHGESSIEELANFFSISTLTVRRDVEEFKANFIVEQKNGKIRLNEDYQTIMKEHEFSKDREAIQKKCSELIEKDDILFINNSFTAIGTLQYVDLPCTCITNNSRVIDIDRNSNVKVYLTGGELEEPRSAMVGEIAKKTISFFNATKCIIGVDGISIENGLTSSVFDEAMITQLMLENTRGKRIVACVSNRIGATSNFFCGYARYIDYIVTDRKVNMLDVYELERFGIKVIIAK